LAYISLVVHDEIQVITPLIEVNKMALIPQIALSKVEREFNIRIKLDCETKVGKTWADTH